MLNIHYFASIRESLKRDSEQLELPRQVSTVDELIRHLGESDPAFKALFETGEQVLVAVNRTVVDGRHTLDADDEIAFFPPMTGG